MIQDMWLMLRGNLKVPIHMLKNRLNTACLVMSAVLSSLITSRFVFISLSSGAEVEKEGGGATEFRYPSYVQDIMG